MTECQKCNGTRVVMVERDGHNFARECECLADARLEKLIVSAGLPPRYAQSSFDNFSVISTATERASIMARRYVEEWPTQPGQGLLFTGPVGTGKTHLEVAVLRELVKRYRTKVMFADLRDLLNSLKSTFNRKRGEVSEEAIMQPILKAEILALDELGAARNTDWTYEVVQLIINTRYNHNLATIITTNLPNRPAAIARLEKPESSTDLATSSFRESTRHLFETASFAPETLGDRIGMRMFSRLQEMCRVVEINSEDYRLRRRA